MSTKVAFRFDQPPAIGREFSFDGQSFTVTHVEPYVRKDGQASFIITWNSRCPECGGLVENKTGLVARFHRRRCPAHVRPMERVKQWELYT